VNTRSVILLFLAAVGLMSLFPYVWRKQLERSLAGADRSELRSNYDRWVEGGRVEGDMLAKFLQGRRADLVVTNQVFNIRDSNYVTQFALLKSKSGVAGTLFVTTNGILLWLDSSGAAMLIPEK
jgi:hypothetical protein